MKNDLSGVNRALDKIAWSQLEHAFGPATDVPELLRCIASDDRQTRHKAWYELHGNLWHQGTIYEATAAAVPILLELLKLESVPEKFRILAYLTLLYKGQSYCDVHQHMSIFESRKASPDFQEDLKRELAWAQKTRDVISSGKSLYVDCLHSQGLAEKLTAAYLLGVIARESLETLNEIMKEAE